MRFRLSVVMDNFALRGDLRAEHGFSLLVESRDERLLVDTGKSDLTVANLKSLEVEPYSIGKVVITHGHYDHAGGLMPLLRAGAAPEVYISPRAFDRKFAYGKVRWRSIGLDWSPGDVEAARGHIVDADAPLEVARGVWLTGPIPEVQPFPAGKKKLFVETESGKRIPDPFEDERAVVLDAPDGLVLISGCGHRGILNALLAARELLTTRPVAAVLGGTHMASAEADEVRALASALRDQDVPLVGPAHCTGLDAWAVLKGVLGDSATWLGAGTRLEF